MESMNGKYLNESRSSTKTKNKLQNTRDQILNFSSLIHDTHFKLIPPISRESNKKKICKCD